MDSTRTMSKKQAAQQILDALERPHSAMALCEGLMMLKSVQEITSDLNPDCIPPHGELPTADQIRTYALALMIETGEFTQELNWKPWKKEKRIDLDRIADEFADMLAFIGIILVYLERLGVDPQMITNQYIHKTNVNVQRFLGRVQGYGVTNHE